MSGANGKVTAQLELQGLQHLINSAILRPVEVGAQLLVNIFNLTTQELSIHRTFEEHLRAGTVTEEILQSHLDSLVAFRRTLQEDLAKKSQPTFTTFTKDTFT